MSNVRQVPTKKPPRGSYLYGAPGVNRFASPQVSANIRNELSVQITNTPKLKREKKIYFFLYIFCWDLNELVQTIKFEYHIVREDAFLSNF